MTPLNASGAMKLLLAHGLSHVPLIKGSLGFLMLWQMSQAALVMLRAIYSKCVLGCFGA